MSRNWTTEQLNAINAKDGSLLVSAAAGSGKTAVLIERVVKRVTDKENPTDVDRLLIVTYTRLAAAELKQRLVSAFKDILKKEPSNKYIRRQLALVGKANISTVDSFCSSVVKEFFYKLDIDSDFRVADETELEIVKNEAVEKTLDIFYSKKDTNFHSLVEMFSSQRNDLQLQQNILKVYEFICSHPFGDLWLDEKRGYYEIGDSVKESVWGEIVLKASLLALQYAKEIVDKNLQLMYDCPEIAQSKICDYTLSDKKGIDDLLDVFENGSWNEIAEKVNAYSQVKFTVPRTLTHHPIKLKIHDGRKNVKAVVDNLKKSFSYYEKYAIGDIKYLSPIVSVFFDCVNEFSHQYALLKAEKHIADYSDLEHWTLDILCERDGKTIRQSDTAKIISQRFDEIIVDEYQDANEVQEFIFTMLSKDEQNMFVVGDVKQSIYGFRQAEPRIFLRRRDKYPHYNEQENNYPAKIILKKNFRSRKGIADGVNFVFKLLMSEQVGDMQYTEDECLVAGASYPEKNENDVELTFIDYTDDVYSDSCEAEAVYIANRIQQMVFEGYKITQNGVTRPVTYGDFAILMRTSEGYAKTYIETLSRFGIPANAKSKETFLYTKEITLLLNLLRVIDNPMRDIPLLSVLMSVLYAFSPDDMALIRAESKKCNLYTALKMRAKSGDEKCLEFLNSLDYYRNLSITLPCDELLITLCEDTGYIALMEVLCKNKSCRDNIQLFIEYARTFEQNSNKGLSAFVSYIDRILENGSDLKGAVKANAVENSVSIISVHSSKGLEYPVCFLANVGHKFNDKDLNENVLLHSKLGIAFKRRDLDKRVQYNTLPRQAIRIKKANDAKSEELRVLYVALTRPKEKLIMVCAKKKLEEYIASISNKLVNESSISPYVVQSAASIADWLVMCALLHQSGTPLREIANRDLLSYIKTDCNWSINIENLCSEENEQSEFDFKDAPTQKSIDNELIKLFDERFDFEYENAPLQKIPVKVSVSDLAHSKSDVKIFDNTKTLKKPLFQNDGKLTAAQKGTATHKFLQVCNFKNAKADISTEINRLVQLGYLSDVQAECLDRRKLLTFFNSDVVEEILCSSEVLREFNFTVEIKARDVDESIKPPFDTKKLILQGSIDLAYEKDGSLIIVDYKTDKVSDISQLVSRYEQQIKLYKYALSQCTEKSISKCILYSLHLCSSVEVF